MFKLKRDPIAASLKNGLKILPPPIDNLDRIIISQKAELLKQEYEEGLTHMRIKENMLSKKEFESRRKLVS